MRFTDWILVLFLVTPILLSGQTTIVLEAGPIDYTNIDDNHGTPVVDTYTADISDCTSIEFSVDFEFSLPWLGVGMGDRMEAADQCSSFGGCAGDPSDPTAAGCNNCWDFMWIQFFIGGSEVESELLGLDLSTPQDGTVTSDIFCTDGETEAGITISNQNWSGIETNTFENVIILCWEGIPSITTNAPICSGQDLDLIGDATDVSVVDDWDWSASGAGVIDDPSAQTTFATGAEDGETYTLVATDENGCEGTAEEVVAIVGGFDATLQGGGDVCVNGCTDLSESVTIGLVGGVEPYDIEMTINGLGPFPLFGLNFSDLEFQICHMDGGVLPSFDDGTSPITITIPDVFWPIDIELTSISDDSGCSGTINGGAVSLSVLPRPDIFPPDLDDPICVEASAPEVDLTMYDDEIEDAQGCDVLWLESEDVTDPIGNPNFYDIDDGDIVYAVVFCDPCYSDFIEVELMVNVRPEITAIEEELDVCGDSYQLPFFSELVDIVGEVNPAYYLDDDQMQGPVAPGSFVNLTGPTSIYIYDESAPGCGDQVEIVINPQPEPMIISPTGTLRNCGNIILPIPDIDDFDDYNYNTEPDGTGFAYFEGDGIAPTAGIDELWLIATNTSGCIDTTEIFLSFLGGTSYTADVIRYLCDTLVLPEIEPGGGPSSLGYYIDPMTTGSTPDFQAGDTLTFQSVNSTTNILDTLYVYDPLVSGTCATVDTIIFEIGTPPDLLNPGTQTLCANGTLGTLFTAGPKDSIILQNSSGDIITATTPMTEDTRIAVTSNYIFGNDSLSCSRVFTFRVDVIELLNAGEDQTIKICEGFEPLFDLTQLTGTADPGGVFSGTGVTGNTLDLSSLSIGTYDIIYSFSEPNCPPDEAVWTIEILPLENPGMAMDFNTCDLDTPLNLLTLFNTTGTTGQWFIMDAAGTGPNVAILDPTNVILSDYTTTSDAFIITHTINNPDADFCQSNMATVRIGVMDMPIAGEDAMTAFCTGTIVDFDDLLSMDASATGTFVSSDGLLINADNEWDTNLIPLGTTPPYEVQYIVDAMGCPPDTAFFIVDLTAELSAGMQVADNSVCEGEVVNLEMFLDGETPGGDFYETGNLFSTIPSMWTATSGAALFTYIIPALPGCDADTTEFVVQVFPELVASAVLSDDTLCDDDCVDLVINASEDGEASVFVSGDVLLSENVVVTITNGVGTLTLCPGTSFGLDAGSDTFLTSDVPQVDLTLGSVTSNLIDCQVVDLAQNETIFQYDSFELDIDTTICSGTSVMIDGVSYGQSESLVGMTTAGCDSTLNININFFPQAMNDLDISLCDGENYAIDSFVFAEAKDTTIILPGSSSNGCDSIVNLDLKFEDTARGTVSGTLCPDDFREVEGVIYDIDNPTDIILLPMGSAGGVCDSVIIVNLEFYPAVVMGQLPLESCDEDFNFNLEGERFDFNRPSGNVILQNQAGCDSVDIFVSIDFLPSSEDDFIRDICVDEDFEVNGTIYNGTNNQGTERMTNQFGCDSIINVQINLSSSIDVDFLRELCEGDPQEFVINGNTYGLDNRTGVEMLTSMAGCDSIINIEITELVPAMGAFDRALCEGNPEEFPINGQTFSLANPTGMTTILGGAANGCDSVITVTITELPSEMGTFERDLCAGSSEEFVVNGTSYGLNRMSGEERISGVAADGCDSIIKVTITELPTDSELLQLSFCQDTILQIGSGNYGPANMMGTEVFVNQFGCDSIVDIDLSFDLPSVEYHICGEPGVDGGTIVITGITGINLPTQMTFNGVSDITINDIPVDLGVLESGNYPYTIMDQNGCSLDDIFAIDGSSALLPSLEIQASVLDDNSYQLGVNEAVINVQSLQWTASAETILSCDDCPDPTAVLTMDDMVCVLITDDQGCIYEACTDLTAMMEMEPEIPDSIIRIYIPTFISADPAEQVFFIQGASDSIIISSLIIYDRWGNKVFVQEDFPVNDKQYGWNPDGDYRVEQGVYVYMLEYEDRLLGTQNRVGSITVIR